MRGIGKVIRLRAELDPIPVVEPETSKYREVHVDQARTTQDVPPRRAVTGRSHGRESARIVIRRVASDATQLRDTRIDLVGRLSLPGRIQGSRRCGHGERRAAISTEDSVDLPSAQNLGGDAALRQA